MSKEAMTLALEALQRIDLWLKARYQVGLVGVELEAIKALEKALNHYEDNLDMAKQEQVEPVAWQWLNTAHFRKKLPKDAEKGAWNPLYTTPQPAQKPLTDELIHEAIGTAGVDLLGLAKLWSDNEIHVYQFDNEAQKIIKAVLLRAHGIKE